jgi:dTDP-4-dehydrorhamnose reductase
VVVTDLATPANRNAAEALAAGVKAGWTDLTDVTVVNRLVAEVSPAAIVHLAAVIPPAIYRNASST